MSGVRTIARIFGFLGWAAVVIGGLALLVALSQLGSRGGGGFGLLAATSGLTAAVVALVLALELFAIWGVLTGLCEIHAQGEQASASIDMLRAQSDRQTEMLDDIRRAATRSDGAPATVTTA